MIKTKTKTKNNNNNDHYFTTSSLPNAQVEALIALLDDDTRAKLNKRMTDSARSFTPANPSGFYRLDLAKQPEREVMLRVYGCIVEGLGLSF